MYKRQIKGLVSEELFNQIATYDMEQGKAFVDQLLSMTEEELKAYDAAYVEKLNVSKELAENLYKSDFDKLSKDYSNAITNALSGLSGELEALGKECMAGFIDGLSADTSYMTNAIKQIANDIIAQFKKELKISSPSKVFASIGGFSAAGYGEGFIRQMKDLKSNLVASVPMQSIARAGGVTTNNHQSSSNSIKTVNQTFNQYNSCLLYTSTATLSDESTIPITVTASEGA